MTKEQNASAEARPGAQPPRSGFRLELVLPSLALLWPLVNFANANWNVLGTENVRRIAGASILGSVALGVVVVIALWKASPRQSRRIALALATLIAWFFLHDAIRPPFLTAISMLGIGHIEIQAYGGLILAAVFCAWMIGSRRGAISLAVVFLTAAIAIPAVPLAGHLLRDGHTAIATVEVPKAHITPNVYVFLLDGYARHDVLSRVADLDNEEFLASLSAMGYTIRRDAVSNYPTTYQSVATLLEMDYVSTPEMGRYTDRGRFIRAIRGASGVVQRFRAHHYAYAQKTDRISGGGCRGIEDVCIGGRAGYWMGETAIGLARLTPLRGIPGLLGHLAPVETLRDLRDSILALSAWQPFFAFVHTYPPHPPFDLDASCRRLPTEETETSWSMPHLYADVVRCVNATVLETAELLATRDPHAIVVFMSDHGSALTVNVSTPLSQWNQEQISERLPNLLAVRMPAACRHLSGTARSPVNVMEVVFACIEGRKPALRKDRFFIGAYETNPDYGIVREVSDLIGKGVH